jgi:protein-S-isoprenylcysteine O-methyltransferase Ste14
VGAILYLSGLSATLQLGDADLPGVLLVPDLPTPLYIIMAVVIVLGVGCTLLVSFRQRRRLSHDKEQEPEAVKSPWQALVSTLGTLALVLLGLVWLMRHGAEVSQFLERLRLQVSMVQELFSSTHSLVQQVQSPATGYAMFTMVILVYGGLGLLGLWMLYEGWGKMRFQGALDDPRSRQVQRAVAAGLQELRTHADPRQAIIACYARLEHLLTDYGVPAYEHLTPQEYMGTALRDVDLPAEAFAGLVALFELARYSLHPLDDTARLTAMAYLEQLQTHLEQDDTHAAHA